MERTEINEFYYETLKELKIATKLKPKSLIEKVGLRKICERVLPVAKNSNRFMQLAKDGTVECVMLFLDEFYGLKFNDYKKLYYGAPYLDLKYEKKGDFYKYLAKVQEDLHLI